MVVKWLTTLIVALALATSAFSADWYVTKDGNDGNDGTSWATAKLDLQSLVQEQTNKELNSVYVGAGTWPMTNFALLVYTNTSIIGTNRDLVILTGAITNRVIEVRGTNVWLEALTVMYGTNLVALQGGGGILAQVTTIITNCNIASNYARNYGGGVRYGKIYNSIIQYNVCDAAAAGAKDCDIYNSTIANNSQTNPAQETGGLDTSYAENCEIYNNSAGYGGGVRFGTNVNCNIYSNTAIFDGGGTYFSSLSIGCNIMSNKASRGGGGYNVTFSNCVVAYNVATNSGGGIHTGWGYNTTLRDNTVTRVTLSADGGEGGGMRDAYLTNCIVINNRANSGGGCYGSSTKPVYNTIIASNVAVYIGGGTYYGIFYNCDISYNTSYTNVGGCNAPVGLYNCNVSYNRASNFWGGVQMGENNRQVYSSIINFNTSKDYAVYFGNVAPGIVNNTIMSNNCPSGAVFMEGLGRTYNNIILNNSSDFIIGGYSSRNWNWDPPFLTATNFKLSPASLCIDIGNQDFVNTNMFYDYYGRGRVYNSIVDIGAAEWHPDDVPPIVSDTKKHMLLWFEKEYMVP